jgi:hypothetical protein
MESTRKSILMKKRPKRFTTSWTVFGMIDELRAESQLGSLPLPAQTPVNQTLGKDMANFLARMV